MKKYILTGLLVWLPLVITIWVLKSVIGTLDDVFAWFIVVAQTVLPVSIHPVLADLQRVPGLSVIILVTALWLTGNSLSFTATIGIIALIGIEIKNSILLVDFTSQLRASGYALREAIENLRHKRFEIDTLMLVAAAGAAAGHAVHP